MDSLPRCVMGDTLEKKQTRKMKWKKYNQFTFLHVKRMATLPTDISKDIVSIFAYNVWFWYQSWQNKMKLGSVSSSPGRDCVDLILSVW